MKHLKVLLLVVEFIFILIMSAFAITLGYIGALLRMPQYYLILHLNNVVKRLTTDKRIK